MKKPDRLEPTKQSQDPARDYKNNKKKVGIKHTVCKCPSCQVVPHSSEDFELVNVVADTGDSIYALPIEQMTGGQIYVSDDKIKGIVNEELDRRLGPSLNKNEDVE